MNFLDGHLYPENQPPLIITAAPYAPGWIPSDFPEDIPVTMADQIQKDLAELIQREIDTKRAGLITLSGVELSADYAHAKVYFSVLTGNPEEATEGLNAAAGFLRNGLFKRLHIHTVPTLHFLFDRTTERASDMNALIAKAVSSRAQED